MKLVLAGAVSTQSVVPGLEEAVKKLADSNKLQFEWVLKVVQANIGLGGPPEFGAVLYPTRRNSKKACTYPVKQERRIVLKPLPDRAKVKTSFLEICFGRGQSFAPLLGTEDCPRGGLRGLISGDRKYTHDFFVIIEALKEILTATNNTSFFPEE